MDSSESVHPALAADLELRGLVAGRLTDERREALIEVEAERIRRTIASGGWAMANPAGVALVANLIWDTEHFGEPSADLRRLYLSPEADPSAIAELLNAVLAHCKTLGIKRYSARVLPASAIALNLLIAQHGFRLVDTSLEIGNARPPVGDIGGGRWPAETAQVADIEQLVKLSHAFTDNRFYRDPAIATQLARGVYEKWVSAATQAGELLCVRDAGQCVGLCTTRQIDLATTPFGLIGLVIVAPAYRGRGVFDALLDGARRALCPDGESALVSSTQLNNVAAQRAFARHGLYPFAARHVLHRSSSQTS
ncbi:MAG: GNAT family N-acetyltransferase [Deltaproteobacteria bacterium]|nr:GNAT family N-acetyltransferase [Deltaproteobacteria bacterium]